MDEQLYGEALRKMEQTVTKLSLCVPEPQRVPVRDSFVYRYVERTPRQALVQKLARYVSTLSAARLLMEHGFVQDQATLQRVLDEIEEDITFLSLAVISKDVTPLHKAYLDAFYREEFDAETAIDSSQKRPMVPRKKIRAYISRSLKGTEIDPGRAAEVGRTISKGYSGFVHAASPQIMEMYGGDPPHFHLRGMRGTSRQDEHRRDLWNYFYRGILACAFTAQAFGDEPLFIQHGEFARQFARNAGEDYWGEDT